MSFSLVDATGNQYAITNDCDLDAAQSIFPKDYYGCLVLAWYNTIAAPKPWHMHEHVVVLLGDTVPMVQIDSRPVVALGYYTVIDRMLPSEAERVIVMLHDLTAAYPTKYKHRPAIADAIAVANYDLPGGKLTVGFHDDHFVLRLVTEIRTFNNLFRYADDWEPELRACVNY